MVMIAPDTSHRQVLPVSPIPSVPQARQHRHNKAAPRQARQVPTPADPPTPKQVMISADADHLTQETWHQTVVPGGQPRQSAEPGSAQSMAAAQATADQPAIVQLPSSSASYLDNPPPAYPAMSRRLGEQGKVTLRVLISQDGSAKQAQVLRSSGFERLDQLALRTVLAWRYVPGQRDGQAEEMWFNVPISFKLD